MQTFHALQVGYKALNLRLQALYLQVSLHHPKLFQVSGKEN